MCLLFLGEMTTSWLPLINLFYVPFLRAFVHLVIFHSVYIFNGFILLVSVILLHVFINFYVCLILIHFLVYNLLECDLQMLRLLTFLLLHALINFKDNFIWFLFDAWLDGHYLLISCIRQYVVCICLVKNGTFLYPFVLTS